MSKNLFFFRKGAPIKILASGKSDKIVDEDTLKRDADLAIGVLVQENDHGQVVKYKIVECIPDSCIIATKELK